ncbi:eukaryotic translation initiation factor 4 gamma 1-like [Trichomycterus rosablanca]|uniref:eukaryotic translation initiation factor 4 gamma 1-like n=1 Tax=Trichomycterus rosablanca TaxID=2290929 RepID=UPI002F3510F4
MNSTAQQVYYCNMADNVQWGSCSYPLYPKTSPYIYPSTPVMMMAPQPQGHIYYIPNGQYCSPYNQHMQQYQYSNYGYYTQYQPSVVPGTMNHVQQHQAPLAQATPALPKRAGKKITIRDPNQGGRDITQEILLRYQHWLM